MSVVVSRLQILYNTGYVIHVKHTCMDKYITGASIPAGTVYERRRIVLRSNSWLILYFVSNMLRQNLQCRISTTENGKGKFICCLCGTCVDVCVSCVGNTHTYVCIFCPLRIFFSHIIVTSVSSIFLLTFLRFMSVLLHDMDSNG